MVHRGRLPTAARGVNGNIFLIGIDAALYLVNQKFNDVPS